MKSLCVACEYKYVLLHKKCDNTVAALHGNVTVREKNEKCNKMESNFIIATNRIVLKQLVISNVLSVLAVDYYQDYELESIWNLEPLRSYGCNLTVANLLLPVLVVGNIDSLTLFLYKLN